MAKEYELLSEERVNLSELSEEEQKHISQIEKLVAKSHVQGLITKSQFYFEVERQAFDYLKPLMEGRIFTPKTLRELYDSPHYKVISDLVTRYYRGLKLDLPPTGR